MRKKSKDFLKEISIEEDTIPMKSKEKEKQEFTELINQSPLNLSVALMKICQQNNYKPLSIENYYQKIFPQMDKIKRTNGLQYKSKSITTIKSAIISNNLFCKNQKNKNLYKLNIKECIKYLKSINKKKTDNKIINNSDDTEISKVNNKDFLRKKRKNSYDFSNNKIKRYKHVYELMENMLETFNKDKGLNKKVKIYFNKCNNYNDIINKYKNNKDILEGMLSMFNYFKPFLKNCLFNMDGFTYLNNLNSKIKELKDDLSMSKSYLK